MSEKPRSPWVWLGCSCAAIVGIGLILACVILFFGLRTMSDPVAVREKALKIMSADAIPPGYQAKIAMNVPFYAQIALLAPLEGDEGQFIYLKGLRTEADLRAAFADNDTFDTELRRAGLQIERAQQVLARDSLRIGAAEIRYALFDGEIHFDFDGTAGDRSIFDFNFADLGENDGDDRAEAQRGAAILIRCSEEDDPGLGLWSGARAVPAVESDTDPDGADSAADRDALLELIEQFGFCRQ